MKVVTANRLTDGGVVWLAADRSWRPDAASAVALEGGDADAALARATEQFRTVVNPYLIDLDEAGGIVPRERLREAIRAQGPSAGHSLEAA